MKRWFRVKKKVFVFLFVLLKHGLFKLIVMSYEKVYSLPVRDCLCFVFVCDIHVNKICNQRVIDNEL
jgi:hypothetical protein